MAAAAAEVAAVLAELDAVERETRDKWASRLVDSRPLRQQPDNATGRLRK
jgi:hypothetical protein